MRTDRNVGARNITTGPTFDGTHDYDILRCSAVMPTLQFTALDAGRRLWTLCPNCYVTAKERL